MAPQTNFVKVTGWGKVPRSAMTDRGWLPFPQIRSRNQNPFQWLPAIKGKKTVVRGRRCTPTSSLTPQANFGFGILLAEMEVSCESARPVTTWKWLLHYFPHPVTLTMAGVRQCPFAPIILLHTTSKNSHKYSRGHAKMKMIGVGYSCHFEGIHMATSVLHGRPHFRKRDFPA